MKRIAQVAITINGECCPLASSQSPTFAFVQRLFELKDGPATLIPGVQQFDDVNSIYAAAIAWLEEMKLTSNIVVADAGEVREYGVSTGGGTHSGD